VLRFDDCGTARLASRALLDSEVGDILRLGGV
jgi:hypothetical protein